MWTPWIFKCISIWNSVIFLNVKPEYFWEYIWCSAHSVQASNVVVLILKKPRHSCWFEECLKQERKIFLGAGQEKLYAIKGFYHPPRPSILQTQSSVLGPYSHHCSSSVHNCEDHFHIHVFIRSSRIWLSYFYSQLFITSRFIWDQHNKQLPVGLSAQLVERCTGIAEVIGSNLVQAWIFSCFIFTTAYVVVITAKSLP